MLIERLCIFSFPFFTTCGPGRSFMGVIIRMLCFISVRCFRPHRVAMHDPVPPSTDIDPQGGHQGDARVSQLLALL